MLSTTSASGSHGTATSNISGNMVDIPDCCVHFLRALVAADSVEGFVVVVVVVVVLVVVVVVVIVLCVL